MSSPAGTGRRRARRPTERCWSAAWWLRASTSPTSPCCPAEQLRQAVSMGEQQVFSAAEISRRRAAFAVELDRAGVSYGLVYGANRSGSAVSWLTGWPVTREALLVAGPNPAEDVLLVSFFNHVPQARLLSAARVEWTGANPVATALDLIAAWGRSPGLPDRIGVAGALPFGQ